MMIAILAQQLAPEPLRALRDQFRQSDSFGGLFLALLFFVAILGLAYVAEVQRRKRAGATRRITPQRLFDELLGSLRLNKHEQALLTSACKEANVPHPASVLISERFFDNVIAKAASPRLTLDQVAALRERLFPTLDRPGLVRTSREK
jgi:hypothetical protein